MAEKETLNFQLYWLALNLLYYFLILGANLKGKEILYSSVN
jgi:hypothetical protein